MAHLLVVDDERSMREMLEILLQKVGHSVVAEEDAGAACERLEHEEFDLVVTDLRLGQRSGLEVLERAKALHPHTEVLMITAFASAENAVQAMKLGAYDYLTKPFKIDELLVVVEKALEKRALVRENVQLRRQLGDRARFAGILGKSAAMRELFALLDKVAPSRTTVLVTGESGVGKELVARALHEKGGRAAGPFVAVNCGAIPEGLIESELFGHEKGAFTGAVAAKPGLFSEASGGTLFLDEIGELPLAVQVKLLRALQQRVVRPVGGLRDVEIDVRIVAATNRDLEQEVREGRFREDLYYRLNVIGLKVPPVRERREDVLLLAEHFLQAFAKEQGRPGMAFSRAAQRALLDYDFPGNVRELENVVERAVTLSDGDEIEPDTFPAAVRGASPTFAVPYAGALSGVDLPDDFDLQAWLDACEREMLEKALERSRGVKTEAAKLLGITFRSIRYRLEKLRMEGGGS
ncbi:sigma-54-dependent transcriptional regulator [Vulgatibacter incomptus]|uniref:Type IV fimbriae expression regulatory protein PilR n=1 Tax=Vulgatibacter incomptus TaxID=1391653 RepID=A0A0K1P9X6_9BACT|nr:sigma-54 dependent transcriptional regulator [Vulgatibacter incomptus]AKU90302.1 Type IV fimbriae expression regulatory protein PilR [Vulgatibacter incomptus]